MTRNSIRRPSFFVAMLACLAVSSAAQPVIRNAKLRTEQPAPTFSAKMEALTREAGPFWVGYEVPSLHSAGRHSWGNCGLQYLEDGRGNISDTDAESSAPSAAYILVRVADHAIGRIVVASPECHMDAGGLPVVWLEGVNQEESVAFLDRIAEAEAQPAENALMAIGVHQTQAATRALIRLASPQHALRYREKASFWLAAERGPEGFPALQQLARGDADAKFREKMTFHLTLVADPRAVDELIRMAKEDSDTKVRSQAMFWLAQKAGVKAVSFLSAAAQNDPEVEVKKKAVFALSQLPREEGVPQLIHVAETNQNREVRKQAIFWLGQSNDPRALKYLEEVLTR
jgi:HEAT repeat protein